MVCMSLHQVLCPVFHVSSLSQPHLLSRREIKVRIKDYLSLTLFKRKSLTSASPCRTPPNSAITKYLTGPPTLLRCCGGSGRYRPYAGCREAKIRGLGSQACSSNMWAWNMKGWTSLNLWACGRPFSSTLSTAFPVCLADVGTFLQTPGAPKLKGERYPQSAQRTECIGRCQECFSTLARKQGAAFVKLEVTQLAPMRDPESCRGTAVGLLGTAPPVFAWPYCGSLQFIRQQHPSWILSAPSCWGSWNCREDSVWPIRL